MLSNSEASEVALTVPMAVATYSIRNPALLCPEEAKIWPQSNPIEEIPKREPPSTREGESRMDAYDTLSHSERECKSIAESS